jgi:hypothetical protein
MAHETDGREGRAVSTQTEHGPGEREAEREKPPGKTWWLALIGLVGTFAALGVYGIAANLGQLTARTVTAPAATTPSAMRGSTAGPSTPETAGSASGSPAGTPNSPAAQPLDVVSVSAFGPEGQSDGDNPGVASRVLNVDTDQPWYTQWYATPDFGGLRPGTGLLLTLDATATVRDVQLVLGSMPGADVQVRVGNSPTANLPTVATESGAAGTVRLALATPATGRYVLIWFTRLPPDGHGHYQVNVYSASVDG